MYKGSGCTGDLGGIGGLGVQGIWEGTKNLGLELARVQGYLGKDEGNLTEIIIEIWGECMGVFIKCLPLR